MMSPINAEEIRTKAITTWTAHKGNSIWGKANGNNIGGEISRLCQWFVLYKPDLL